jgi:hypothetical protein
MRDGSTNDGVADDGARAAAGAEALPRSRAAHIVVRNYRVLRRRLDGKTVLRAQQLSTEVDPTLDALWSLIDGERSVEQLARLLATRHGFDADACLIFVSEVLGLFEQRRLISLRDPASAAEAPPPSDPTQQRMSS